MKRPTMVLALVVGGLAAMACGKKKDECTQVTDKMRPVLVKMGKDLGKPFPEAKLEEILAEMCTKKDASDSARKSFSCVLAAAGQTAVAACLEAEMKAFQEDIAESRKKRDTLDKKIDDLDNKIDALGDAGARAATIDAAVASAPKPKVTPVDLATLPAWDVPKGTKAKGPPTTVYAADLDGGRLLGALAPSNYLILPIKKKLTGRVIAKSQAEAAAAVAAHLGVDLKPPAFKKSAGVNVDLQFASAPVVDLYRLLADIGRVNIVAPGNLGEVDIRVKRVPWDQVLDEMTKLTNRKIEKSGNLFYIVPSDAKLPERAKVKKDTVVDVDLMNGTSGHLLAALRKVTDVDITACGGPTYSMRLKRVPLSSVYRAMEVMTGAPLAAGTCTAKDFDGTDRDNHKLVAIVSAGTTRAAAFDHKGEIVVGVKGDKIVDIGSGYVSFDRDSSTQLYSSSYKLPKDPDSVKDWVDSYVRTAGVIKIGNDWGAFLERSNGELSYFDPKHPFYSSAALSAMQSKVDERGLEVEVEYDTRVLLPLATSP